MTDQIETQNLQEQAQQMNGHTLMLIQFSSNEETRTYVDTRTPDEAMETLCRIFENFLANKKGLVGAK